MHRPRLLHGLRGRQLLHPRRQGQDGRQTASVPWRQRQRHASNRIRCIPTHQPEVPSHLGDRRAGLPSTRRLLHLRRDRVRYLRTEEQRSHGVLTKGCDYAPSGSPAWAGLQATGSATMEGVLAAALMPTQTGRAGGILSPLGPSVVLNG